MKTKVLFAAAILLSTAALAQEVTAKSELANSSSAAVGNSGSSGNVNNSSTSNAHVKTSAADKAARKSDQTKQEAKNAIATQKEAVAGEMHTDVNATQEAVRENSDELSGVHSDTRVSAKSEDNKVTQDASLGNKMTVSDENVKSSGKEVKKEGQTSLNSATVSTIQTSNAMEKQTETSLIETKVKAKKAIEIVDGNVQTNAKATTATALKASTGIQQVAQPKPASIKMQTQVIGNAGLKIK